MNWNEFGTIEMFSPHFENGNYISGHNHIDHELLIYKLMTIKTYSSINQKP